MITLKLADPEVFEDAPCTKGDPDRFFMDGGGAAARHHADIVKRECARCLVRSECLQIAMDAEGSAPGAARFGVYGGLMPSERARMAAQ